MEIVYRKNKKIKYSSWRKDKIKKLIKKKKIRKVSEKKKKKLKEIINQIEIIGLNYFKTYTEYLEL